MMKNLQQQSDKQSIGTCDATSIGFSDNFRKSKDNDFHPTYVQKLNIDLYLFDDSMILKCVKQDKLKFWNYICVDDILYPIKILYDFMNFQPYEDFFTFNSDEHLSEQKIKEQWVNIIHEVEGGLAPVFHLYIVKRLYTSQIMILQKYFSIGSVHVYNKINDDCVLYLKQEQYHCNCQQFLQAYNLSMILPGKPNYPNVQNYSLHQDQIIQQLKEKRFRNSCAEQSQKTVTVFETITEFKKEFGKLNFNIINDIRFTEGKIIQQEAEILTCMWCQFDDLSSLVFDFTPKKIQSGSIKIQSIDGKLVVSEDKTYFENASNYISYSYLEDQKIAQQSFANNDYEELYLIASCEKQLCSLMPKLEPYIYIRPLNSTQLALTHRKSGLAYAICNNQLVSSFIVSSAISNELHRIRQLHVLEQYHRIADNQPNQDQVVVYCSRCNYLDTSQFQVDFHFLQLLMQQLLQQRNFLLYTDIDLNTEVAMLQSIFLLTGDRQIVINPEHLRQSGARGNKPNLVKAMHQYILIACRYWDQFDTTFEQRMLSDLLERPLNDKQYLIKLFLKSMVHQQVTSTIFQSTIERSQFVCLCFEKFFSSDKQLTFEERISLCDNTFGEAVQLVDYDISLVMGKLCRDELKHHPPCFFLIFRRFRNLQAHLIELPIFEKQYQGRYDNEEWLDYFERQTTGFFQIIHYSYLKFKKPLLFQEFKGQ